MALRITFIRHDIHNTVINSWRCVDYIVRYISYSLKGVDDILEEEKRRFEEMTLDKKDAALLETVLNNGECLGEGNEEERMERSLEAIHELEERDCKRALIYIVEKFSSRGGVKGDRYRRRLADIAADSL